MQYPGPGEEQQTRGIYKEDVMLPTGCPPSDETCCNDLYDIASNVLSFVHEALVACQDASPCCDGTLLAYVTMGAVDDGIVDAVTVDFSSSQLTTNSVRGPAQVPFAAVRTTFTVRLIESGWPVVQVRGDEMVPPDPVAQNYAARHAFAHGELMYRELLRLHSSKQIVPASVRGCLNTQIGTLVPLRPQGGTVGFEATFTVDLAWGGG